MASRFAHALAGVVVVAGCGRVGFDEVEADAPQGSGPFGSPVELTVLDTNGADDPALTATGSRERSAHVSGDGKTLWFVSNASGNQDIWVATRPDTATPFGAATVVSELASNDDEDDPWVSADAHQIYFARYAGSGPATLWVASR